jgi:hypothetical protein
MPTLALLFSVWGCTTAADRALGLAQRRGMETAIVQGTTFRHLIVQSRDLPTDVLYVFIDGDGTPWGYGGTEVARDPTPHRALALELALHTAHSDLYLGRPCHFQSGSDPACTPPVWTSGRYSSAVVDSMAAVVNRSASDGGYRRVVLIGYSGGGTLAVLLVPRVPAARAVITIAANLDVAAWSQWHRYLPLDGSLDPAQQPPLPSTIFQWHLVGGRDLNVPERLVRRYVDTLDVDSVWRFPTYDHTCCWVQQWAQLMQQIDATIAATSLN